jgi:hypothetical protein
MRSNSREEVQNTSTQMQMTRNKMQDQTPPLPPLLRRTAGAGRFGLPVPTNCGMCGLKPAELDGARAAARARALLPLSKSPAVAALREGRVYAADEWGTLKCEELLLLLLLAAGF